MTDIVARWPGMRSLFVDMDDHDALDAIRVCQACYDFAGRIPGWLQVRVAKLVYVSTVYDRSHAGDRRDISNQ